MEKLIEKVENLKTSLDNNEDVKKIKQLNKIINEDKELLKLLAEYTKTKSNQIKEKIISNPNFRKYKEQETNINIIILELNQRLKEIIDKGKCSV